MALVLELSICANVVMSCMYSSIFLGFESRVFHEIVIVWVGSLRLF